MPTLTSISAKLAAGIHRIAGHLPLAGPLRPLRGSFSALDRLRNGECWGEILRDSQQTGPCPAGSITERCGMRQHDHQPWPVFWTSTDEARLVGSLLHWRDPADRICEEGCYHQIGLVHLGERYLSAQAYVPRGAPLRGAWTSLVSQWGNGRNYYHWLIDSLPRLWVREHLPEPTRVLIPEAAGPFVRESLELLGLDGLCEAPASRCVRPERFYFCSPLAMTGCWNPLGLDWLRNRFQSCFKPAGTGVPLFLTRRATTRVPKELDRIESLFEQAGFRIVDGGRLGLREQIELASAAPAIAGIHGAAMTNILWARPGTPVLEIFQPAYLNACYEQIAFQGGLRYSALVLDAADPSEKIERWLAD